MFKKWSKTPTFIKKIVYKWVWDIPKADKKIFLTFDDGPIPDITEWVLDVLKEEKINATFFCIGANIEKHQAIFERIKKEGHQTGNHTWNHLNGWNTKTATYIENIQLVAKYLPEQKLFRPPYGKLTLNQGYKIRKLGYKIIMWDVLSYDFDPKTSPEECLNYVISASTNGSIIVFHDSLKAAENMKFALPKVIKHFKKKGYSFGILH
jgi:peptidoglycan/xylan/chitin deacetylase (PgdA/CDA1 family)